MRRTSTARIVSDEEFGDILKQYSAPVKKKADIFEPPSSSSARVIEDEEFYGTDKGSELTTKKQADTSGWAAAGRSLLDAATFGFDDEILGYTGLGELFGLGNLEEMRERKRQLEAAHPWIYNSIQIGGYLVPARLGANLIARAGAGLGGAAARMIGGTLGGTPAGAGFLPQVLYGGASGALAGIGAGEGFEDSLIKAGREAALGAGVSGAAHVFLSGAKPAWDLLWGHGQRLV